METALWKIFDTIDLLVRYAEGKNINILTFLGLQLTAVKFINININIWLEVSSVFLVLSVLLCVASFMPKSRLTGWLYRINHRPEKPAANDNILFYGDIAKYNNDEYIGVMEKNLACKISGNGYHENLCKQIVVNAKIVDGKFRLFKFSFSIMLIGEMFFSVSLLDKIR